MRFLRRNKFTIIAIFLLIVFVFIGVQLKSIFVPDEGKASYGDRLSEIKDHKLSNDWFTKIEDKFKENDKVSKIENKIHGKIINLIITVNGDVDVNTAKEIGNSTIGMFENDELTYYSLQVYLKKDDEKLNNFPIIGYKGTTTDSLIYSKDRDIVQTEENTDEK